MEKQMKKIMVEKETSVILLSKEEAMTIKGVFEHLSEASCIKEGVEAKYAKNVYIIYDNLCEILKE